MGIFWVLFILRLWGKTILRVSWAVSPCWPTVLCECCVSDMPVVLEKRWGAWKDGRRVSALLHVDLWSAPSAQIGWDEWHYPERGEKTGWSGRWNGSTCGRTEPLQVLLSRETSSRLSACLCLCLSSLSFLILDQSYKTFSNQRRACCYRVTCE